MINQLQRQIRYVRTFNAYSPKVFLRELGLFPYDYLIRKGNSSSVMSVVLFLTFRCNLWCSMCNFKDLLARSKDMEDPPLHKVKTWLNQLIPYKPNLLLLGGEPLLHKNFIAIVRETKKRGMGCGVFTNGTLFSPENVKASVKNELDYVVFSIHGDRETHNRIVNSKKAYQKAVQGLELFYKCRGKTKIVINCMLCEVNLECLESVVQLGETWNVDAVRFGHPTFFSKQDMQAHDAFVKKIFPGEFIPGISYHYDIGNAGTRFQRVVERIKRQRFRNVYFSPELTKEEIREWYSPRFMTKRRCYFIWRGTNIYPNGDVVPCDSIGWVMGNLNETSFNDIWNNKKYSAFRNQIKSDLLPGCTRCCKL